jgi:hypothetical protein
MSNPWENEPDSLDFEAEGLKCAMRRNERYGVWCGYVGVPPEHPLFGLPYNQPLKLPPSWFEGRTMDQGIGPFDVFIHALSGAKSMDDATPICIALHVHGGCNYAEDHVPDAHKVAEPDGWWWFGFDCMHAGDLMPGMPKHDELMNQMIDSMPEHVRATMRDIVFRKNRDVYRDQQYVVSECQSLATQLNAIVGVLTKENAHGGTDHRPD